ncbi:kinetochore-associated Ndc80 complex subunit ndc80 [Puccinia graminis f. sp. tritici]|uniref:Kinetochore protein NDC80 n=1 Tax=Puccinia graminis f. sp. tritici TaxID=56615 RepID=A0A5B0S5Q5_PUCGR|nr:kinetochore-associated Ndc80 complex subunit ndc80 [Puccinia graminis f. sp. tritici]
MSVNKNEHAHYRSSSANDVPPAGLLNSHSTPSANRASSVGPFQESHHVNSSLLPPFQTYKDPRTRNRNTIASWRHQAYEFLLERGYPEPLTIKTLQAPTTKDFQNIFKFLI